MPHTVLRLPTVKARTGLSRSTIYSPRLSRRVSRPRVTRGTGRRLDRGRGERVAHRADQETPDDRARGGGHYSDDAAQDGDESMTPRRPTKARVEGGHDEEHGVDSATFYDNQDASQSGIHFILPGRGDIACHQDEVRELLRPRAGSRSDCTWRAARHPATTPRAG